ncbi:MAG: CoB--CoM heterodisulfide reductase iron-sulfur subunit B family protein [Prolixibacteraceae bacterium]|jgi:heterodisulfide reductase subunit B|nr:CoB--CoM heterodisulfide reductase iron-sulfur subunit B family protein [Prolixibacteraceae bacterium]
MKIGFYPGCSLTGSSREYNESVVASAKALEIELVEIKDWNCCGATAAHVMNEELSLSLPARIMAMAEEQGLTEVVVPCAACYNRLKVTQHELEDEHKRTRVIEILKQPYKGDLKIINVLQMLEAYGAESIKTRVTRPFAHKVACYYGCLLVRPHSILKFDRVEDPQSMDTLIKAIGGTTLDWAFKTECCGAGFSVSRTDLVAKLSGNILKDANDRGAEAVIVACPLCQSNLDMRRGAINKTLDIPIEIPVIYITQAIGLALGIEAKELGLKRHFVTVEL